jgi:hypothetical protein
MNFKGILVIFAVFITACGDDEPAKVPDPATVSYSFKAIGLTKGTLVSKNLTGIEATTRTDINGGLASLKVLAALKDRKIELDILDASGSSLVAAAMEHEDIKFPTIFLNDCQLTVDDVVQKADGEYSLNVTTSSKAGVYAKNCLGVTRDLLFEYIGPSVDNVLQCSANGLVQELYPFTSSLVTIPNAPVDRDYVCNTVLSDGSHIANSDGSKLVGNSLAVQGMQLTQYDIRVLPNEFGFVFHLNADGSVQHVLSQQPVLTDVSQIDVTIVVKSYVGFGGVLTAYCDFNGWQPIQMAVDTSGNLSYTYQNVATNDGYACNFIDPSTGNYIYDRNTPSGMNFVVLANGVQIIRPHGDNLLIEIDRYGQIVVTMVNLHIELDSPGIADPPVYLIMGNLGDYQSWPMQYLNSRWMADISLPEGVYEANVSYDGGAFKAMYVGGFFGDLLVEGEAVLSTVTFTHARNWFFSVQEGGVSDNDTADTIVIGIGGNF